MEKKGTLYFFTGLAGAGKTTLGGLFYQRLKNVRPDAVLIDGDTNRTAAAASVTGSSGVTGDGSDDERYTTEARKNGAKWLFQHCRDLTEQGFDVVCCSISMYNEIRGWNRENIANYKEIYVRVQWETLLTRNQKGLYSPGRKNVVGVDLPYDEPEMPDVVIQNDGHEMPETIIDRLFQTFGLKETEAKEKNL